MKRKKPLESGFFHVDKWLCLFDHNLLDAHLRARGEAQEVNALGQVAHIDLLRATTVAVGHHLTHAVVHHEAVVGIAATDVQHVADGVGIDAELGFILFNAIHKFDEDAFRSRQVAVDFGDHTIGVGHLDVDFISIARLSGLSDFNTVAIDVI